VVFQINYDVIKLQEYQIRRHFGDVIKLHHLKYVIKIFHFQAPSLVKSWLRPWSEILTMFRWGCLIATSVLESFHNVSHGSLPAYLAYECCQNNTIEKNQSTISNFVA